MQGFIGDQTPLGELAHWISQDQHFPKYERISDNILSYFTKITTLDHEFFRSRKAFYLAL